MNLNGFDIKEAEEILQRERERADLVQQELQRRIYRGEVEATDAEGVVTMRDLQ